MAASDAIPVPRKNTAYRFYFAIRKPSDSTLITTWTGQDSEVSLDGAAYSDCTNEATEIGTTGTGYIDLTAAEMNADCVMLKVTVTNTGAVPLVFALYPESAGDYRVADTQKVDVETIKTRTLTAASNITVGAYVGGTAAHSTLTQADITGGAYTVQSASCVLGDGRLANLDATVSSRGTSTLTQTQVTGGAYAINSSSFAFNATLDFTTTQKAATLARVTLTDTVTTYTGNTPQTGDSYAIVSSGVHGNAAIKGYVDDIGPAGAGLTALGDTRLANLDATVSSRSSHNAAAVVTAMGTGTFLAAIPWNAAWDAEVQSEVQDAIEVNHLDHLLAADYDPASKPGVATALFNELIGSDAGVSQFTANALELAPSAGGGTDWTADEKTAIRAILGVPVSGTTPDDPTTGIMDTIRDSVATRASQASIDDFVLNSMEVY